MNNMGQSIAVDLLLFSSGWLEVATARQERSSRAGTRNRILIEKYGAECNSSSLSVLLSTYCDIMDESPSRKCCDSIFATLGRKNCLCKVVREPNYRSSSIAGGSIIVDLYRACDGGPYISPTSEEDCDHLGREPLPPPPPPPPPNPSSLEDDLKGRLAFWRKVGWTAASLLVLLLLSVATWIAWKRFGCSWFRRGHRLDGGGPESDWWSCLKREANHLWNSICQLGHGTGVRARRWWTSIRIEAAETTADAPAPTWNVMVNNIFVCKFGFSPKFKEQDPTATPGSLELPTFRSPEGDLPSTTVPILRKRPLSHLYCDRTRRPSRLSTG